MPGSRPRGSWEQREGKARTLLLWKRTPGLAVGVSTRLDAEGRGLRLSCLKYID